MADVALVVSTPDVSSVRDADRVVGIIDAKSERAARGEEVQKYVIINRAQIDLMDRGDMMSVEDVLSILALPLIGVVPDDQRVISSTNLGKPVVHELESRSGEAYRRIARRMLGEEIEFLDLKEKKGLLGKLKGLFK